MNVAGKVEVSEERNEGKETREKLQQKKQFDRRHTQKLPEIQAGDSILVRIGLPPTNKKYKGPFEVRRIESFENVTKRFFYEENGKENVATLRNVILYTPRRE